MQDKNSYIHKSCSCLGMTKKDLGIHFKVTLRTVDNWANKEDVIPVLVKMNIDLMIKNKKLIEQSKNREAKQKQFLADVIKQDSERKNIVSEFMYSLIGEQDGH